MYSGKNYPCRLKLRKSKYVDLEGKLSNWTGKEEKNYKTHNAMGGFKIFLNFRSY